MSEPDLEQLVYLAELEGLGDAHLIGGALEQEGIQFKVAVNRSSGFDVVIPQGWGMLYVDPDRKAEAMEVVQGVRDDQRLADADFDPDAEVESPAELMEDGGDAE